MPGFGTPSSESPPTAVLLPAEPPRTEELGGLRATGSQRAGHDRAAEHILQAGAWWPGSSPSLKEKHNTALKTYTRNLFDAFHPARPCRGAWLRGHFHSASARSKQSGHNHCASRPSGGGAACGARGALTPKEHLRLRSTWGSKEQVRVSNT